jgi:tetratricopeptide (TPR) repeat protein
MSGDGRVGLGAGLNFIRGAGEGQVGGMSMQGAANNRFIITGPSFLKGFSEPQARTGHAALYKQLGVQLVSGVYSDRLFIDLGDKLLALAEQAYGFRQGERLEELSQALLALPLPDEYKSAARYFHALGLRRRGQREAGNLVLEEVATEPTHRYTARAVQSLGAVFHALGDYESALKLSLEAGRRAAGKGRVDPATALLAQENIATIKGLKGDHRRALADLERLSPLVRAVCVIHPHIYYDHLNSLAVELGELGRLEEAARTSRITLSSPFAVAYPEWHQTFDEIASKRKRASHSAVAVRQPLATPHRVEEPVCESHNLLHLPLAERPTREALVDRQQQGTRARVLNFQEWKTAMKASSRATPEGVTAEQRSRMTTGEKLIRLMDLISQDETDDETIDRILEAVERIVPNCRSEKLD